MDMAIRVKNGQKIKHAVYLRSRANAIAIQIKKSQPNRSVSSIVAGLVTEHRKVSQAYPGAVIQARQYAAKKKMDEFETQYQARLQLYLDLEDSDHLEVYSDEFAGGNRSVGLNKMITEVAAIAIVCPQIF